jgi:hypothetical protein
MNNGAKGSSASCTFSQTMVDQGPRYEKRKMFRKKLKPGRPSKRQAQQHWLK